MCTQLLFVKHGSGYRVGLLITEVMPYSKAVFENNNIIYIVLT